MSTKKQPAHAAPAASRPAAPAGKSPAGSSLGGPSAMTQALAELWPTLESGDVLQAEISVAGIVAAPRLNQASRAEADEFFQTVIARAARSRRPELAAAFYRVLMSLATGSAKKMASGALREVTSAGAYPPGWVTQLGKPAPVSAWHRRDVFGEVESVVLVFAYGEQEHAILVRVDRSMLPVAAFVGITTDPAALIASAKDVGEHESIEQVSLEQARRLVELPLARAARGDRAVPAGSAVFLPVALSHIRRLPAPAQAAERAYAPEDRTAAIEEFLASPAAAQAGADPEAVRFWARALTGYSGRVPDEPPAQVGPRKARVMLAHVAATFPVPAAARAAADPVVTAWMTWAAQRQGLSEAATKEVLAALPEALAEFAADYDSPGNRLTRSYTSDVAATEADMADITDVLTRRATAIPIPRTDDPQALGELTDPARRAEVVAAEFGSCELAAGQSREDLLTGVTRVAEELWSGEPPATWQQMQDLLTAGASRHDAIHKLADRPR